MTYISLDRWKQGGQNGEKKQERGTFTTVGREYKISDWEERSTKKIKYYQRSVISFTY